MPFFAFFNLNSFSPALTVPVPLTVSRYRSVRPCLRFSQATSKTCGPRLSVARPCASFLGDRLSRMLCRVPYLPARFTRDSRLPGVCPCSRNRSRGRCDQRLDEAQDGHEHHEQHRRQNSTCTWAVQQARKTSRRGWLAARQRTCALRVGAPPCLTRSSQEARPKSRQDQEHTPPCPPHCRTCAGYRRVSLSKPARRVRSPLSMLPWPSCWHAPKSAWARSPWQEGRHRLALLANGLRCVAPCSCKTRSTRGERARAARSLRPVLWFPPRLARRSACAPPAASHHSAQRTTAAWCLALNGAVRAVACNVHVDRRRGPRTPRPIVKGAH